MSRQKCNAPHCTGKADDSGRCWRHRPRRKLVRSKRLNKVNRPRKAKLFVRNYGSSERVEWLKAGGCEVARQWAGYQDDVGCWGPLDAMHVKARGMGGCKGDADDLVCGCRGHHIEASEFGTADRALFEAKYAIDLQAAAAKRAAEWAAYKGEK